MLFSFKKIRSSSLTSKSCHHHGLLRDASELRVSDGHFERVSNLTFVLWPKRESTIVNLLAMEL